MAKYYQPRYKDGDKFVRLAKQLNAYTLHLIEKLPIEWKEYILIPLYESSSKIEDLVILANKVYIPKNKEEKIKALNDRDTYLVEAIREFSVLENKFDRICERTDLISTEASRLKGILRKIINDEMKENQDVRNIEIKVKKYHQAYEYTSLNGTAYLELKMTVKNKETWVKYCYEALNEIKKRLALDKSEISNLLTE